MRLAKLIGEIYEVYGTVTAFCDENNLNYGYISRVLNGKVDIKKSTINKIAEILSIAPCDIGDYFFPECCTVDETKNND